MDNDLLYEIREGIGFVTFNRPKTRNALTFGMYEGMANVLSDIEIGCGVHALVFAGVAVNNTFISPVIPVGDSSGLGVSRMVGSFLPSVLVLAVGLWLLQKPKA